MIRKQSEVYILIIIKFSWSIWISRTFGTLFEGSFATSTLRVGLLEIHVSLARHDCRNLRTCQT